MHDLNTLILKYRLKFQWELAARPEIEGLEMITSLTGRSKTKKKAQRFIMASIVWLVATNLSSLIMNFRMFSDRVSFKRIEIYKMTSRSSLIKTISSSKNFTKSMTLTVACPSLLNYKIH